MPHELRLFPAWLMITYYHWELGTVISYFLWWFIPHPQTVYSHKRFDQYPSKSGALCRSLQNPLCAPFSSLVLWPAITSCLSAPRLSDLSLQFRETMKLCLVFPFLHHSLKTQTVRWGSHRFHLISFLISGIIILHCLMFSDLNTVLSNILSGFCGCIQEGI